MIIHKLHLVSFGKFKNKTVSFENGLNYIYGENEAGKSTLMAFIKAMLYGFGSGVKSDRARYAPWDGTKLAGEMEVTLSDARRVIIRREQGKTKAADTLIILDAVTGAPVSVSLEDELGVGEAAFLKTVFIPQLQADIAGGDKELTEKLLNLVTSGDTDTGYEEAIGFLTAEKRLLKAFRGDGGRINELKREITELKDALREAEEDSRTYFRYISEEKALSEETEVLKRQILDLSTKISGAKAKNAFDALQKGQIDLEKAENNLSEAEKNLSAAKEREEALSVFRKEIDPSVFSVYEEPVPSAKVGNVSWILPAAVLSLLSAGVLGVFKLFIPAVGFVILSAVFGALGIKNKKEQKERSEHEKIVLARQENIKALLSEYGCKSIGEYTEKRAELLSLSETIRLLEKDCAFCLAEAETKRGHLERLSEIAAAYEGVETVEASENTLTQKLQDANLKLQEKERALMTVRGVIQGASEGKKAPDLIETEISCKEEELMEAEGRYNALCLAMETLEDVFRQLSMDFTPRINKKASEFLSVLTGQEESLLLDKKYAVTMGRGEHRPLEAFSGGTMDQAFLSVRLAIASLLLEDKNTPVFLDDVFIQYDEKREENAFKLLREIAKDKQVILFSCRKRETESAHIIEL